MSTTLTKRMAEILNVWLPVRSTVRRTPHHAKATQKMETSYFRYMNTTKHPKEGS